jgi:hypothetical protein
MKSDEKQSRMQLPPEVMKNEEKQENFFIFFCDNLILIDVSSKLSENTGNSVLLNPFFCTFPPNHLSIPVLSRPYGKTRIPWIFPSRARLGPNLSSGTPQNSRPKVKVLHFRLVPSLYRSHGVRG